MSVYIIAEAGVNHNGNVDLALKMIDAAKDAGCDCIKFQTFHADKIVTRSASKAEYQKENTGNDDSQYDMLRQLELSYEDFERLKNHCAAVEIDFMSTPFDEEAADMLQSLHVDQFKIPSGEITNQPLISHVASFGKRMLMSTGMATLDEVREAMDWIYQTGNKDIVLFHCTSNYPAPYADVNMRSMETLKDAFGVPVGYSDHTKGIEIPLMAVAMGAQMIEKHFTLSREMDGPDHKASLEPMELKAMVQAIRHIESAFGDGIKKPALGELSTRAVARKSLVFARDVQRGETLSSADILCKRPGTGIPPKYLASYVGRRVIRSCAADELLDDTCFEK